MYKDFFKRFIDFSISLIVIVCLSPLMVIIFIFIKIFQGGPVFFIQERPGLNEKTFKALKLKTMNDKTDFSGNLLPDGERLTGIGKILRSTSLDELPQFLNVIKGDMSLVGPRPLLIKYLPLYSDLQKRRHEVRPGITGWAQINGRNDISWQKKFELDVWYVDHLSAILDIKIIFLTIKKVLRKEGVSKKGFVTTNPFNGYN